MNLSKKQLTKIYKEDDEEKEHVYVYMKSVTQMRGKGGEMKSNLEWTKEQNSKEISEIPPGVG